MKTEKLYGIEALRGIAALAVAVGRNRGLFVASLSFIYGAWMIADKLMFGNNVPWHPSIIVSILFLGGVQLIGIGVLGEYIGRIYVEVKQLPRYVLKGK